MVKTFLECNTKKELLEFGDYLKDNFAKFKDYEISQKDNLKVKRPELEQIGEEINEPKLNDLVLEDYFKEQILNIIRAINEGKNLDLCFSGMPGTGKTTIAKAIAVETKRPFVTLTASSGKKKIAELLVSVKPKSIILIDEIHNIREDVAEIIYPAIQDSEIYHEGKLVKLNEDIIFIGTTTDTSRMPKPLLDRFINITFEEPSEENLYKILLKRGVPEPAVPLLLNYSNNIRKLNQVLNLCSVYKNLLDVDLILKVFDNLKINAHTGLNKSQEKYIEYLKQNKKASLRIIAQVIRMPESYIRDDLEPDLIRKGIISITSRGRELAEGSYENIKEIEKFNNRKEVNFRESDRQQAINYLKEKGIGKDLGSRYLELINEIAGMLHRGENPDLIDFDSFSDDIKLKESVDNTHEFS